MTPGCFAFCQPFRLTKMLMKIKAGVKSVIIIALSSFDRGLIMDFALDNNSSLLPILLVILASFVQRPVVDVKPFAELTLWTGRASEPCTAAPNKPFLAL